MVDATAFNADRTLKLIRSDKGLSKLYNKRHPGGNRNEAVLRSMFNALIKGDKNWMIKYEQTK